MDEKDRGCYKRIIVCVCVYICIYNNNNQRKRSYQLKSGSIVGEFMRGSYEVEDIKERE